MSELDSLRYGDKLQFGRDAEVIQIPSGNKITLPRDTEAMVTQTLGGNVTLQIPSLGILVQITGRNLDALLKGGVPVAKATPSAPAAGAAAGPVEEKDVWETLKTCYDPEIPCNIVDLGLVYDVKLSTLPSNNSRVDVKMTLTAMGCGMGPAIAAQARDKILDLPGVAEANVEIVWDPPWNQSMITEAGRKRLGIW